MTVSVMTDDCVADDGGASRICMLVLVYECVGVWRALASVRASVCARVRARLHACACACA